MIGRILRPLACLLLIPCLAAAQQAAPSRAPAVPLVTHNPYFSVWSMSDRPTDDWSRHWTGKIQAMSGMVRVDGKAFRVLGPEPKAAEAMTMIGCEIWPLRTIYTFEAAGVEATLTFTSPLIPSAARLDLLTRPISYVSYGFKSRDGKSHKVQSYFDATAEWAVNAPDQKVEPGPAGDGPTNSRSLGMSAPKVLGRSGDDLRIEWGRLHVGASRGSTSGITSDRSARGGFVKDGKAIVDADLTFPRAADDRWPLIFQQSDVREVRDGAPASWDVLIGYDEDYAMEYMGQKLRPYWKRGDNPPAMTALLDRAAEESRPVAAECRAFDEALMADLVKTGGKDYAGICALSFRQCLAAHGYAALPDGKLLMLSKENFSNGCIGTVDVTYPSAPFFLLFNADLLKAQVTPVLDYGKSDRWKFPFAPHDLGQYPLANGQVYGGGEKTEKDQMPVEECGNMLILVAAIAKADGNADYAKPYWPLLTKWADYLKSKGLDPENQLCTDDFAGHLAHNTNLSLKAIVALGGYAKLAETLGKADDARTYREAAREMAARWVKMAADGDHYRLTFDKPGTWSQKYNLVWDRLLGLDLFPPEVARDEIAYYLTQQKEFGLPLDNRTLYTKLDWIVWTATMASSRGDFEAFMAPLARFVEKSPSRVPLTDWYWTQTAKQQGFQARSVVGGVFIKQLAETKDWGAWSPVAR